MHPCRQFPSAKPRIIVTSTELGKQWGLYLKGAGFDETVVGGGRIYLTTVKSVVADALNVLPNFADLFTNVDFIRSSGVFNLSLAVNNLAGQAIPKNLRTANAASLQQCAIIELGMSTLEAASFSRQALYEKLVNARILSRSFVGINSWYEILVNPASNFSITVRRGRPGTSKIQLSFTVSKNAVIFNMGQQPICHSIY